MKRPKVVTVRAQSRPALVARATAQAQELTAEPGCERVLVVYRSTDAQLYVENAEGPSKPDEREPRGSP